MLAVVEVLGILVPAIVLLFYGLVANIHAVIYLVMSAVLWFALAVVWLIDGGTAGISILFMGLGLITVVLTISEGMMVTQKQVEDNA